MGRGADDAVGCSRSAGPFLRTAGRAPSPHDFVVGDIVAEGAVGCSDHYSVRPLHFRRRPPLSPPDSSAGWETGVGGRTRPSGAPRTRIDERRIGPRGDSCLAVEQHSEKHQQQQQAPESTRQDKITV